MAEVRTMCAIGLSGQLGLHGHLPWEGDTRPEFKADVARFFDMTRGHVLMAGPRTIEAVPEFARADLTLVTLRSGDDPQAVLDRMLAARHELATLLGYPSWAAYATEDKMIGSAAQAADFIARITTASAGRADRDYAQLLSRKRVDDPQAAEVQAWDSAYYQERIMAEEYGFDSQALRAYFEYAQVKQGVLDVTARMFGLRYEPVRDATVWHPEVDCYDVYDDAAEAPHLGRIYLDMHPREGKYKHYAQFTLSSGVAGRQLPEERNAFVPRQAGRGAGVFGRRPGDQLRAGGAGGDVLLDGRARVVRQRAAEERHHGGLFQAVRAVGLHGGAKLRRITGTWTAGGHGEARTCNPDYKV